MRNWHFVDARSKVAAQTDGFTVPGSASSDPTYTAGGQGRRLRIWRPGNPGPNAAVLRDLQLIRSRQRAAARNDPWAGTLLDKLDSNGIATGIQCKMLYGSDELQASTKLVWRRFIDECDADGNLDWYGMQLLAWHELNEVGEVLGRLRPRRPSDGFAVPFQVQLIEAEQCPSDLYTIASNGNQVKAGIEFNAIGKKVAFWMYREHPGDRYYAGMSSGGTDLVRVPAELVLHLYRPLRAGQLRGIPDSVSVLMRMFNLENMDDAVLERQKIANLFAMFYTRKVDPEDPESIVDEMTTDEDGVQELDEDDDTPLAGLEPGTAQELPTGVTPEFSNPPSPGADYAEYLRGQLLAICARHGVPYEVATGDLRDVSDRALRLILNEFRRNIEMRQWLTFIPKFCQPVRTHFFDQAWLSGALDIPDYMENRAQVVETLWVPQGWPYSHPVQDVVADIKAIRAGLASRSATTLRNGEDPEEVIDQIATDNAEADKRNLVLDSDPRKVSSAGLTQARAKGTEIPNTDIQDSDQEDITDGEDE